MSLDTDFVGALMASGRWDALRTAGLTEDWLFDDGKGAFTFVRDFFREYGKVPELATVEELVGVPLAGRTYEPLEFYIDRLKTRFLGNMLAEGVEGTVKKLRADPTTGPKEALEEIKILSRKASELDRSGEGAVVDLRVTADDRWNYYQELKALGGRIDGIETPWRRVNERTRGLHKGELWVIVARLKTGKSWFLVVMADHMWKTGERVLLVSQEMAVHTFSRRIDAKYSELSYEEFRSGMLDVFGEQKYRAKLDEIKVQKQPLIVAGAGIFRTIEDVEVLIEETHPTVVLIDGVYLMKDAALRKKGGSKYDHVSRVVDELQVLAQRKNVPIVVSTQFNRKVDKGKHDAGAEFTGYAYEIAQNAHVMIGLFRDQDDEAAGRMRVRLMESREGRGLDLMLAWDLSKMDFKEIGIMKGDELVPDDAPVPKAGIAAMVEEPEIKDQEINW